LVVEDLPRPLGALARFLPEPLEFFFLLLLGIALITIVDPVRDGKMIWAGLELTPVSTLKVYLNGVQLTQLACKLLSNDVNEQRQCSPVLSF